MLSEMELQDVVFTPPNVWFTQVSIDPSPATNLMLGLTSSVDGLHPAMSDASFCAGLSHPRSTQLSGLSVAFEDCLGVEMPTRHEAGSGTDWGRRPPAVSSALKPGS